MQLHNRFHCAALANHGSDPGNMELASVRHHVHLPCSHACLCVNRGKTTQSATPQQRSQPASAATTSLSALPAMSATVNADSGVTAMSTSSDSMQVDSHSSSKANNSNNNGNQSLNPPLNDNNVTKMQTGSDKDKRRSKRLASKELHSWSATNNAKYDFDRDVKAEHLQRTMEEWEINKFRLSIRKVKFNKQRIQLNRSGAVSIASVPNKTKLRGRSQREPHFWSDSYELIKGDEIVLHCSLPPISVCV